MGASAEKERELDHLGPGEDAAAILPESVKIEEAGLQEKHFTIFYGDTGYSYASIVGPYLKGAKEITVDDPYLRMKHQIQNFVRFCEMAVKEPTIRKINLNTSYDDQTNVSEVQNSFEEIRQSLIEMDVVLDIKINPNMHDREIRIDNGWVIKIGRGLDLYQEPNSWFEIGVNDFSLRKCLETKVDIFKDTNK
ncbi:MAG: MIT C-terminal domain-containing protein [Thermodesulfobacteriota bacterium]